MANLTSTPTPSDLAVFGGSPTFDRPLHVGAPNIGSRERFHARLDAALDRRWLTNSGVLVREFEEKVAQTVGTRHAIATSNGTVALELLCRGLELSGEIIVPAFTFVATAHALQWMGLTPIFCDIDPVTCTADPTHVRSLITPRTGGIIGVHLWAQPCDTDRLAAVAASHRVPLAFDASHAFGCEHLGRMIGGFGEAEAFSFHATKCLNSLEGGAIVTNNDDLARALRRLQNFGFGTSDVSEGLGINAKMSEASAAMGLTNLESLPQFVAESRERYLIYKTMLAQVPGVRLRTYDETQPSNYHYVVVELSPEALGLTRDELMRVLVNENVLARRYFYPGCHNVEPYRSRPARLKPVLPSTDYVMERVLCLPTGSSISIPEVQKVCELLQFVCLNGHTIAARLRSA